MRYFRTAPEYLGHVRAHANDSEHPALAHDAHTSALAFSVWALLADANGRAGGSGGDQSGRAAVRVWGRRMARGGGRHQGGPGGLG